jgi:hypothetical protein
MQRKAIAGHNKREFVDRKGQIISYHNTQPLPASGLACTALRKMAALEQG